MTSMAQNDSPQHQPISTGHPVSSVEVASHRSRSFRFRNRVFLSLFAVVGGTYLLLILLMLGADLLFMMTSPADTVVGGEMPRGPLLTALNDPNIQASIRLSLLTCTLSAVLSLMVGVPLAYLMSRTSFRGQSVIEVILDIPIVLPPLVVGLSLLILFQYRPFSLFATDVIFQVPAIVLAQFVVTCAFAVRTLKVTFDQIDPRSEQVARTLGCSRAQAFGWVVLPEAKRGIVTAFTLAWARALGEFGPLLIFAGATRMRTEVLSTSIYLELNVGNLPGAVAVSFILIVAAGIVLTITRLLGTGILGGGTKKDIGTSGCEV